MKDPSTPKSENFSGRLFCILFGLPFFGAGLGALAAAAGLLKAQPNSKILLIILGSLFALIGGAFIYAGLANQKIDKTENLRNQYPNAPWKWKEAWHTGTMKCSSKSRAVGMLSLAVLWNAISLPILLQFPNELSKGNKAIWIALLFPLVGIGFIYSAIRAIIQFFKFGESTCTISGGTGVIGGELRAMLRSNTALNGAGEAEIVLECSKKTTSQSGKNRSTHTSVLWQEKRTLPKRSYSLKSGINICFTIPSDCVSSSTEPSRTNISWRLIIRIPTDGVDYEALFEVPVFRTDSSSNQIDSEFIAKERPPSVGGNFQDYESSIKISSVSDERHYFFPAGRHKSIASVLLIMSIALAIGAFLAASKLSIFLGGILFLFDLLLIICFLLGFCQSSKVIAKPGSLKIIRSIFGIKGESLFSLKDIARVTTKIGMQSSSGSSTTLYYDIVLQTVAGKPRQIASSLKSKLQAEQIAEEIERTIKGGLSH